MNRNVELKAMLADPQRARTIASTFCPRYLGCWRQVDTYFQCRRGRLKLREMEGEGAELIWYWRPDQAEARPSQYYRLPVADAGSTKELLRHALGLRGIVTKQREVWLVESVRVHIDAVQGLGWFLELESIVTPQAGMAAAEDRMWDVYRRFAEAVGETIAGSYIDLLETTPPDRTHR